MTPSAWVLMGAVAALAGAWTGWRIGDYWKRRAP